MMRRARSLVPVTGGLFATAEFWCRASQILRLRQGLACGCAAAGEHSLRAAEGTSGTIRGRCPLVTEASTGG